MGGTGRVSQALLAAPLAPLAATFCAGIACEPILNWHGGLYTAATALLLAGWLICRLLGRFLAVRLLLLAAVAFVLGGLRMGLDRHALEPDHVVNHLRAEGEIVRLRGEVQSRPNLHKRTLADFPGAMPRDPSSTFVLRVRQISHFRQGWRPWQPASGLVSVQCTGPALQIEPGQPLDRSGILRPVRPALNPGGEGLAQSSMDDRLFATFWLPTERDDVAAAPDPAPAQSAGAAPSALRDRLSALLDALRLKARGLLLGDAEPLTFEDQTLLDGLVLGHRGQDEAQVAQPFLRTGTFHFMAISGLHMAILAGVTWSILRLLRVRPRRSALIVLLTVVCYCLMAEARPPILRAGIMIGLVCLGLLLQRETHSVNLLAMAAMILLAFSPAELLGAGFQLSFVVVLGLVLFTQPFYQWLYRLIARRSPPAETTAAPSTGWLADHPVAEWLLRHVLQIVAVSAVAWIVGWPLTAYYFHRFYPWSIISSIALWVPMWFALSLSFVKMLVSVVLPGLGAWLNGPLHSASGAVLATVRTLDRIPGMSFTIARPAAASIVLFYVYLAAWHLKFRPRWISVRWMLVVGLAGAAVLALPGLRRPDRMELTVLAVEDGLCQVVHMPDGRTVIFDCGSLEVGDVGEQVVVPFLAGGGGGSGGGDWCQPMRVDAAFVSHSHIDHYGGFPGLARRGLLSELIVSPALLAEAAGHPSPARQPAAEAIPRSAGRRAGTSPRPRPVILDHRGGQSQQELTARFVRLMDERGTPIRVITGGSTMRFGQVRVDVLWPPPWIGQVRGGKSTNDTSLVVRLTFAGRSILLTGDIEKTAEGRLLDGHANGEIDLRADVLVMPHHGAMKEKTTAFIRAVNPQLVIISTGRKSGKVLSRCPALFDPGRAVLVTSESGAATAEIEAGQPGRVTWHGHLDGR